MNTTEGIDQLIEKLTTDLKPVKRLLSIRLRTVLWTIGVALFTGVLLLITGDLRPGWMGQLASSPQFQMETFLGLFAIAATTWFAIQSMIPGEGFSRRYSWAGLVPFSVFFAWVAYGVFDPAFPPSDLGYRMECVFQILGYSVPPWILLFLMAKRAFCVQGALTGLYIGGASALPVAVGMEIACKYDPMHMLQWHLVPVVLVGIVGVFLGHFLLKK